MPAFRTQEPPDALAATVLPADHGGCLRRAGADIRQSLDRYQSRIWRIASGEGGSMPRRKSLVTVIRDMVREQVQEAVQGLLGAVGGAKKRAKNGRRRRRRRRGPGRPPGSKNKTV